MVVGWVEYHRVAGPSQEDNEDCRVTVGGRSEQSRPPAPLVDSAILTLLRPRAGPSYLLLPSMRELQ